MGRIINLIGYIVGVIFWLLILIVNFPIFMMWTGIIIVSLIIIHLFIRNATGTRAKDLAELEQLKKENAKLKEKFEYEGNRVKERATEMYEQFKQEELRQLKLDQIKRDSQLEWIRRMNQNKLK